MNALEKIKLSKESIAIVSRVNNEEIKALEKVRLSRRLNEIIVLLGGQAKPTGLTAEGAEDFHQNLKTALDENHLSDNTNDENYRWKDTALIAGARKHMSATFLQARKEGRNVNVNDIDWDEVVADPRSAEALIKKENIFGIVDWNSLRDAGMPSNVAYLIKRAYGVVGKVPIDKINPESMRNYVTAVSTFRESLEKCRDYESVKDVLTSTYKIMQNPKYLKDYYQDKKVLEKYKGLQTLDARVLTELGDRYFSWSRKTMGKALFECRTGRSYDGYGVAKGSDWVWLDGEPKLTDESGKPVKPRKTRFQLEHAEDIERIGGKEVDLKSSKQLEEMFGFRGIQSGNWVLKDKSSAEFHMKAAAEAMLDMADIVGIDAKHLGLNGNLALAFGARGKGGALAHYEPSSKVINITKMKGGGSLGHEYFHAMDNLIRDLSTGEVGSSDFYATRDHDKISDPDLAKAFKQLNQALSTKKDTFTYENEYAKDLSSPISSYTRDYFYDIASKFTTANGGLTLMEMHEKPLKEVSDIFHKWANNVSAFRLPRLLNIFGTYLTVRHYSKGDVPIKYGKIVIPLKGVGSESDFYKNAVALDAGVGGKYWSKDYEMAARSFSAYLQDKLEAKGRKNDYLAYSTKGGNSRTGEIAYALNEEREAINAAFDHVFEVIRAKKLFEKASQNKALLDALFNNDIIFADLEDDQNFKGELYDTSYPPDDTDKAVKIIKNLFIKANWKCSIGKATLGKTFNHDAETHTIILNPNKLYTFDVSIFNKNIHLQTATFNGVFLGDVLSFINDYITGTENKLSLTGDAVGIYDQRLKNMEGRKYPEETIQLHDVIAQSAATSEYTGDYPSVDQLIENNYQKANIQIAGLDIVIENPIGSVRRGIDPDGHEWEIKMTAHYGYIKNTIGADGDELDIFVAPNVDPNYNGRVLVISQIDRQGNFDEHKVILGIPSKARAIALYQAHYDENFNSMSSIVEYSLEDFKEWIYEN